MPQKFQRLKKSKKLTKSSQKWLLRQINDPYVERAKAEGWRSRAAFKIIEIDQKFKLFKKGKIVVDLGAAPGGWSQYAVKKAGEGNVVAIDLLEIDTLAGVNFFVGDFMTPEAPQKIIELLKTISYNKNGKCDIVMSDMAANTTGDHTTDHLRIIALLEEALTLGTEILKEGGSFVGKVFQGGSSDEILKKLRTSFSSVKYFKPDSSRKDSSETYLVAMGFRRPENT
ncbi:MAG: RlmE family RNA methyltransferase [Pelagibacterales bacterium]|nr:RlmE family RNA methyltransferase [Pelagibacterales bacterium]